MVELRVAEWEPFGLALPQLDPRRELGPPGERLARAGEHLGALVKPDDGAAVPIDERPRDQPGAGGDVQHPVAGAGVDGANHGAAPAWVLPEAERRREQVVAPGKAGEQR